MPALTTDVIVGFPGETDADFTDTCEVARTVGFSKIHVFSWSPRRGTPAAMLDGRVPPQVIAARREELQALSSQLAGEFHRQLIGRRLDVLVEGPDRRRPGHVVGTSCRYAPVSFEGHHRALLGQRVPVRAMAVISEGLAGQPEPGTEAELPTSVRRMTGGRMALPLAAYQKK